LEKTSSAFDPLAILLQRGTNGSGKHQEKADFSRGRFERLLKICSKNFYKIKFQSILREHPTTTFELQKTILRQSCSKNEASQELQFICRNRKQILLSKKHDDRSIFSVTIKLGSPEAKCKLHIRTI